MHRSWVNEAVVWVLDKSFDNIQNKYVFLWCLSMEQPTSDSQIFSVTQLFFKRKLRAHLEVVTQDGL